MAPPNGCRRKLSAPKNRGSLRGCVFLGGSKNFRSDWFAGEWRPVQLFPIPKILSSRNRAIIATATLHCLQKEFSHNSKCSFEFPGQNQRCRNAHASRDDSLLDSELDYKSCKLFHSEILVAFCVFLHQSMKLSTFQVISRVMDDRADGGRFEWRHLVVTPPL